MPAGAQVFELSGKLALSPADYVMVQSVHHAWVLFASTMLVASAAIGLHSYLVSRNATSFGWSMVALVLVGAAQIVFWAIAYPANAATDGWSVVPVDFELLRRKWEYAFAAAGILSFAGLLALVRSIGASRPFASLSILESIEREAAVRAARMRALSADGGGKPTFQPDGRQNRAA
ncbi:MAG: hypothetical protein ABI457_13405 [Hyphomicrobium sp.]